MLHKCCLHNDYAQHPHPPPGMGTLQALHCCPEQAPAPGLASGAPCSALASYLMLCLQFLQLGQAVFHPPAALSVPCSGPAGRQAPCRTTGAFLSTASPLCRVLALWLKSGLWYVGLKYTRVTKSSFLFSLNDLKIDLLIHIAHNSALFSLCLLFLYQCGTCFAAEGVI